MKSQPALSLLISCSLSILLTWATVYHPSLNGKLMANGEKYNHHQMSCASRYLPLGTRLIVKYSNKGITRNIAVTVTDRIPEKTASYRGEHVIDLSGPAWSRLTGNKKPSRIKVKVKVE